MRRLMQKQQIILRIYNDNSLHNASHTSTSGKGHILKVTQASILCMADVLTYHSGTVFPQDVDQFVDHQKWNVGPFLQQCSLKLPNVFVRCHFGVNAPSKNVPHVFNRR